MFRKFLHGKIHGARVTATAVDYEGSIGVDAELLEGAGILPNESVHVWNVSNGERFETYAIAYPKGSRAIVVNGAAAHKTRAGDQVIIAAFTWLADKDRKAHRPRIIILDAHNRIRKRKS